MKRLYLFILIAFFQLSIVCAQDAKTVLEKCASVVSNTTGIQATFVMESAHYGNMSGTIVVKGKKFHATTAVATMWFDGTTQWTYLKSNDEVSVTTPNETQQQALNPYNFINMYKSGFKYTMSTAASDYKVHLTSTDAKRKIQELFITINKNGYIPTEVKLRQGTKWTTFTISNFKKGSFPDSEFCFNPKDYPSAEVIDLR